MKKPILTLLVLLFLIPISLRSQISVSDKDSLALVAVFNSLGGNAAGLNWDLTKPVSTWGDTPLEILLRPFQEGPDLDNPVDPDGPVFPNDDNPVIPPGGDGPVVIIFNNVNNNATHYVASINLSGKELEGIIPNKINDFDFLDSLILKSNRISGFEGEMNIPSLRILDISSNRLYDLPPMDSLLLDYFYCQNNYLKFEDIEPVRDIGKAENVYAPQARIPEFTYGREIGDPIQIDGYLENNPSPFNVYSWTKDGASRGNGYYVDIPAVLKTDEGRYELSVTNPQMPDLTIESSVLLKIPLNAPFTSVVTNNPKPPKRTNPNDPPILVRKCECLEEDIDFYLWEGLSGWIEHDTTQNGRGSGVDKDTSEINFYIPFDPVEEIDYCGVGFTTPNFPTTGQRFAVRTGVVGTGIAQHDSLIEKLSIYRQQIDGPDSCFTDNQQLGFDYGERSSRITNVRNPHETHVAGIVAQNLPPDVDMDLLDVKILKDQPILRDTAQLFDLICAIHFAVEKEVKVLNLSLGYQHEHPSVFLYKALKKAEDNGVLVVVSAGNKGLDNDEFPRWPGNFTQKIEFRGEPLKPLTNIIVVAALNETKDSVATFSNYGVNTVHIAAAGTRTSSTVVTETGESIYTPFSGTSMAAAEVSRVISILRAYVPNATPQQVIKALMASSQSIQTAPTPTSTSVDIAPYEREVNLVEAARALGVPTNQQRFMEANLQYLNKEVIIEPGYPSQTIINRRYEILDDFELILDPSGRNYSNIIFRVYWKRNKSLFGSRKLVFESTCAYGNKINWDGIWNRETPDTVSDLSVGQYWVEVMVNGEKIRVMPNKIIPR